MYVREHNRLAREFALAHPTWSDQQLYHESRRLVIATHQKIVSREYMATLTGRPLPPYTGYNASIDPAMYVEVDGAAFRYGHVEFSEMLWR